MAGELEGLIQDMFDGLAKKDVDAMLQESATDVQGVDEISRRWIRGSEDLSAYIRQLAEMADDVVSEMRDVHESTWGDTGLVTFWLEQDYTLNGERQHISAPTTAAFRREGGDWKLVLFHSIPLADDQQPA